MPNTSQKKLNNMKNTIIHANSGSIACFASTPAPIQIFVHLSKDV